MKLDIGDDGCVRIFKDGELIYHGEYNLKTNKREGYGEEYDRGEIIYKGEFLGDQYHGNGTWYQQNCHFIGEFKNGKRHGRIKYYYRDELTYIGIYANGLPNGQGIMNYGPFVYKGNFVNGKPHGFGKSFHMNGGFYIGEFKNRRKHGKGIYIDLDKRIDGIFDDDLPKSGIYKFTNGDVYTGTITKFQQFGQGTIVYANGATFTGRFNNNRPVLDYDKSPPKKEHWFESIKNLLLYRSTRLLYL